SGWTGRTRFPFSFLRHLLVLAGDVDVELGDVFVLYVDHVLELVDVDLFDVFLARRPLAFPQAADATDDLDEALQQQAETGDGDDRLERIDGRSVGRDVGVLVDRPGLGRVVVAGPEHSDHAR